MRRPPPVLQRRRVGCVDGMWADSSRPFLKWQLEPGKINKAFVQNLPFPSKSGRHRPSSLNTWVTLGRTRRKFGRHRSILAESGQNVAQIGQNLTNIEPNLAGITQIWSNASRGGPHSAEATATLSYPSQNLPTSTRTRPNNDPQSADIAQHGLTSTQARPRSGQIQQNSHNQCQIQTGRNLVDSSMFKTFPPKRWLQYFLFHRDTRRPDLRDIALLCR